MQQVNLWSFRHHGHLFQGHQDGLHPNTTEAARSLHCYQEAAHKVQQWSLFVLGVICSLRVVLGPCECAACGYITSRLVLSFFRMVLLCCSTLWAIYYFFLFQLCPSCRMMSTINLTWVCSLSVQILQCLHALNVFCTSSNFHCRSYVQ